MKENLILIQSSNHTVGGNLITKPFPFLMNMNMNDGIFESDEDVRDYYQRSIRDGSVPSITNDCCVNACDFDVLLSYCGIRNRIRNEVLRSFY